MFVNIKKFDRCDTALLRVISLWAKQRRLVTVEDVSMCWRYVWVAHVVLAKLRFGWTLWLLVFGCCVVIGLNFALMFYFNVDRLGLWFYSACPWSHSLDRFLFLHFIWLEQLNQSWVHWVIRLDNSTDSLVILAYPYRLLLLPWSLCWCRCCWFQFDNFHTQVFQPTQLIVDHRRDATAHATWSRVYFLRNGLLHNSALRLASLMCRRRLR